MKYDEILDYICNKEITDKMVNRFKHLMVINKETGEISWNRKYLEKFSTVFLHQIMKEMEDMVYG